jgi:thioredoxin-dependent peroxiredoxin
VLYGASTDSPEANKAFAEHNHYSFVLLSDPTTKLAKALGVRGLFGFAKRWTFFIDDRGVIRRVDKSVHTGSAGADLVRHLTELGVPRRSTHAATPAQPPAKP